MALEKGGNSAGGLQGGNKDVRTQGEGAKIGRDGIAAKNTPIPAANRSQKKAQKYPNAPPPSPSSPAPRGTNPPVGAAAGARSAQVQPDREGQRHAPPTSPWHQGTGPSPKGHGGPAGPGWHHTWFGVGPVGFGSCPIPLRHPEGLVSSGEKPVTPPPRPGFISSALPLSAVSSTPRCGTRDKRGHRGDSGQGDTAPNPKSHPGMRKSQPYKVPR